MMNVSDDLTYSRSRSLELNPSTIKVDSAMFMISPSNNSEFIAVTLFQGELRHHIVDILRIVQTGYLRPQSAGRRKVGRQNDSARCEVYYLKILRTVYTPNSYRYFNT
jgi:hypothetical protein